MAIVSCPECGKKLKVADTSVGKKVKGPCGHVFVAQGGAEAVLAPAVAVAPEKVYVGCTECNAKLKVATTSLGKKMKCPKCSAVFVAALPDEEPAVKPMAKAKPAVSENDMDDLLAFAQADAAGANGEVDDENPFKNEPVKSRAQRKMDEKDAEDELRKSKPTKSDGEPMPKSKKQAKPSRSEAPARPVYPSRLLPNVLVALLLLAFGGLVGAIFFGVNIAKELGLPEFKGSKRPNGQINTGTDPKLKEAEERNKKELDRLEGAWIVESPDELKGKKYIFADGKATTPDGQNRPFSVDAAANPKWINLPVAGKTSHGIYELEGDTLRFCVPLPHKGPKGKDVPGPRPKNLDAAEGMLVVLTREKKAEPTDPPEAKKAGGNKEDNKEDKKGKEVSQAEKDAAAVQANVLTTAVLAYRIKHKGQDPAKVDGAIATCTGM